MRRILVAILALTVVMSPAAIAIAQCPTPPSTSSLAEGEIGLFFDPLGTQTCGNPSIPYTTLFVVARVPEGGVAQFTIPALVQVSGLSTPFLGAGLPPGSAYIAGGAFDACASAYRPDAQSCPVAQGDLLVIAQVTVLSFGGNGTLCFQTACPWIGGVQPVAPGYLRCDSGGGTFVGGESMCIGFGEAPVATENFTWGAVKAIYR